jgi:uncharacterized protein (UPF0147 family)
LFHRLYIAWEFIKQDVRATLKVVLTKILYDQSVTADARRKRAEGIEILGKEYSKEAVNEATCIEHLLKQLGNQSGLFGEGLESANEKAKKHGEQKEGEENDNNGKTIKTKEYYLELKEKVRSLSVKELKSMIHEFDGDEKTCIERSDLESCLSSLIQIKIDSFNE